MGERSNGGRMRFALALLMTVHGIAHQAGFAESFHLTAATDLPYKTTILGGRLDLGGGIRVMGVLWLVLSAVFIAVAVGTALNATWWVNAAGMAAMASLVMTLLEMPQARTGVVNLAILAALFLYY
jgi:hypothetical protein